MAKQTWRNNAELIGIAAIIASLILVAYELRQNSEIAAAETRSTRYFEGVEFYAMLAEDAELAELFTKSCGDEDHLLTDAERLRVSSLWMRVFFMTQWSFRDVAPNEHHTFVAAQRLANASCESYRQTFESRRGIFSPDFVEFMEKEVFNSE